ncbi:unnamed protein product [Miscanthus lutarioriparius]|uniref:Protein kinase domain-containing protein n=1 Tax=Miscanthus lutarioriparius TaxID=422564 RepID=A0A811Q574_9POAL|nr:unnamed protein product [Miscanthus lutarioriparius]
MRYIRFTTDIAKDIQDILKSIHAKYHCLTGTIGYLPPEFINYQVISKEYDIYSLGVVVTKIVTGTTGYSDVADMGAQEFAEHVHENWKKYLQEIPNYASLEVDCKQVKRCIEIARRCMENDPHKRPKVKDIVSQLDEIEMENFKLDESAVMEQGLPMIVTVRAQSRLFSYFLRRAIWDDPLLGLHLHVLVHPLFGYGKFEFRFLHEAPSPVERRICDACGEPTRGYVYHCSEQDHDLHQCWASLPVRFLQDGRAFDLHRRASRPCAFCPDNEGRRRRFWAYLCYVDGDAVDLHVACLKESELKETARRSWEAYYRKQDVGDGAMNFDSMLENMFSSSIGFHKFGKIAGTLASFITALVFGNLIVKM